MVSIPQNLPETSYYIYSLPNLISFSTISININSSGQEVLLSVIQEKNHIE